MVNTCSTFTLTILRSFLRLNRTITNNSLSGTNMWTRKIMRKLLITPAVLGGLALPGTAAFSAANQNNDKPLDPKLIQVCPNDENILLYANATNFVEQRSYLHEVLVCIL